MVAGIKVVSDAVNKRIVNFLIKDNNNGYIWNIVAGIINAAEAVILSMIITRTNGLEDAGILSIAFAVGNLFANIGKFGVRNYQVSDVKREFSFSDYFISRIISVGMMLLVSVGYILEQRYIAGYSWKKAIVVFCMCLIYLIEALEDVFWGLYQKKNALDVGAKVFSLRWLLTIFGMAFVLIFKHNLLYAMLTGLILSTVAFVYLLLIVYPHFKEPIQWKFCKKNYTVLKKCFPLFAVAFMTFYITNVAKYSIDRWLTDEIQACYGFIAMPVFVIGLLNGFIYQPVLVRMSIEWENGERKVFLHRVYKQCGILLGIIAICFTGAFLFGIPVLSMIYATDLSAYRTELLILMMGGGMLAVEGFFGILMTIMRKQKWLMWGFFVISLFAHIFSDYCVKNYGVLGATLLYSGLMGALAVAFVGMFYINIRRCGCQKYVLIKF